MESITIALIASCMSHHVTTEYEPNGGYNENNKCLGIHAEKEITTHWEAGILAEKFKDSFSKNSKLVVATAMYNIVDNNSLNGGLGLGLGYIQTSYYNGAYAGILAEASYKRVGVQLSYLPKIPGADSVFAVQGKIKLLEW